jgi:hypothetical protein
MREHGSGPSGLAVTVAVIGIMASLVINQSGGAAP